MPLRYSIDARERLVLTVGDGTLTDADVMSHKERLRSDPEFTPDMDQLTDVRGVTDLRVTTTGVQLFAQFDRRVPTATGRRLAIVASDQVTLGLANLYKEGRGNAQRVGVFTSMDEAREWLGRES